LRFNTKKEVNKNYYEGGEVYRLIIFTSLYFRLIPRYFKINNPF